MTYCNEISSEHHGVITKLVYSVILLQNSTAVLRRDAKYSAK